LSQHILVEFCIRLAAGLACMMAFILGRGTGTQFYRTLMLVVLGLDVLGWLNAPDRSSFPAILLAICACLSFVGFVVWTLGRVATGSGVAILLALAMVASLVAWTVSGQSGRASSGTVGLILQLGGGASSALLLGSMLAAMLLGHTYLISPTMSIEPLRMLVCWIAGSIAIRSLVSALALVWGESGAGASGLPGQMSESLWWWLIAARAVIGLIGPGFIAWMVWQTAKIRSTQSATGILYAGVVLVFFGELLGQLLRV
jgi:hypothetical protein